ncbi:Pimeloyl-ACP methyl ester carboxylesterase [Geosmithia morbida]|uniref:Pimeloyl-ACP methyl ester carboxylesterase n=1 Tax=Geosmithia morbida TaxID=1094350 RepID=A0A9P5D3H6_9HYPO|nr:Pimeloyl-ACP methyl ester carboxylesterase [Geosmithia morbida]KAF4122551.1 Pimeloyl-ACP methyl ester carboxylesterase [Geosmithia morbida]
MFSSYVSLWVIWAGAAAAHPPEVSASVGVDVSTDISIGYPAIVLVPGAFGTPAGYDRIVPYLEDAGFETVDGAYPSSDPPDPADATSLKDIAHLRDEILQPLLDEGRELVVVAHSYGGIVAGGAAKNLSKTTRRAHGLAGGVVGLFYIAGNIAFENQTLLEAVGGAYPDFIKLDSPSEDLAIISPAMDVLYNDLPASDEPELAGYMTPHAYFAFQTPPSAPAWAEAEYGGRRTYIRTLRDRCNPPALQDLWLSSTGVTWDVVGFNTSHMPFVSQPEALAIQLIESAKSYA